MLHEYLSAVHEILHLPESDLKLLATHYPDLQNLLTGKCGFYEKIGVYLYYLYYFFPFLNCQTNL